MSFAAFVNVFGDAMLPPPTSAGPTAGAVHGPRRSRLSRPRRTRFGRLLRAAALCVSVLAAGPAAAQTIVTDPSGRLNMDEGDMATYTVRLGEQPAGNVQVRLGFSISENLIRASLPFLTFTTSNWDRPQTVTVTARDDNSDNAGGEQTTTITHTASGYPDVVLTVAVRDDEAPPAGTIGVSKSRIRIEEDPGSFRKVDSYTIRLGSRPSGDVTVTPSANPASSVRLSPTSLFTFTPDNWWQRQQVNVTAVDDRIDQGNSHSATITHTAVGGGYDMAIFSNDIAVTITDNDRSEVTVSKTAVVVTEASGTDTYTVVLDNLPSGNVTITLSSGDPSAATVEPSSLIFTASNWNMARTVTVSGVGDDPVTISHTVAGADYDSVTVADVMTSDFLESDVNQVGGVDSIDALLIYYTLSFRTALEDRAVRSRLMGGLVDEAVEDDEEYQRVLARVDTWRDNSNYDVNRVGGVDSIDVLLIYYALSFSTALEDRAVRSRLMGGLVDEAVEDDEEYQRVLGRIREHVLGERE